MEPLGIAVVQMRSQINKLKCNLTKIEHFSHAAKEQKIDLVCFPELSITGYSRERAAEMAESIPGTGSTFVSNLAQELNITILAGLVEKNGLEKPFNCHFIAFPDGKFQVYRKSHLGLSERTCFSPGQELPVFKNGNTKFGIEICWEMHFPEITTVLALNGCEVVFAPHASPVAGSNRKNTWLKYLAARAYDNSLYVAACNLVGYDGEKQEFGGGALIIDPKGNIVSEYFGREEKMVTAYLDLKLINDIRTKRNVSMKNSFYLSARRPELYGDLIKGVK